MTDIQKDKDCGCPRPVAAGSHCDLRKVTSVVKSGENIIIAFDDCTFAKANFKVVDDSFGAKPVPKLPEVEAIDASLTEALNKLKTSVGKLVKREVPEDKVTDILNRIATLEEKEDKDTVYDDSKLLKRIEELEAKEDKDTIFDPTELVERTSKVEARVQALEDTPAGDKVDVTAFVRKDELVDVQDFEGNTSFRAIPPTPRRPEAA